MNCLRSFLFPDTWLCDQENTEMQKLTSKKIAGAILAVVKGQILIDGCNSLLIASFAVRE